jgi:hypothetical protein
METFEAYKQSLETEVRKSYFPSNSDYFESVCLAGLGGTLCLGAYLTNFRLIGLLAGGLLFGSSLSCAYRGYVKRKRASNEPVSRQQLCTKTLSDYYKHA